LLAPSFAFRRANVVVVDRQHYIDAVTISPPRTTSIRSVTFAGKSRAAVSCVVTNRGQGTKNDFDNLRVFIRADDGRLKLLAWANKPV